MDFAPIAVFGYRRPQKLQKLLDSLSKCKEAQNSQLYIFVDGPKSDEEVEQVRATRRVAKSEGRFRSVTVSASRGNLGLSGSIVAGVSRVLNTYDRIIVLEDDLLVSPHFLAFMNDALSVYETTEEVVSVHAYLYPVDSELPETFFLRGADCWGWGTWRRGWSLYNPDSEKLLASIVEGQELRDFDFNGYFAYSQMLRDQISGKNDSWAVRWYASAFLAKKLTLYPNTSLAINSGMDGSGTHGRGDVRYLNTLASVPISVEWQLPAENREARKSFEAFFKRTRPSRLRRVARSAKALASRHFGLKH